MRDTLLIPLLFVLFFLATPFYPCQAEELVIVQSVSTTKRTFAIRRGNAHGITLNLKALFSNDEVNIIAKCTDITRFFSVWEPVNQQMIVPFLKGEFVSYNRKTDNLGLEIVRFKYNPQVNLLRSKPSWILKMGLTRTLSGAVSSTGADNEELRTGFQVEGAYKKRFYKAFSWMAGIRYDHEVIRLTRPILDIPINRYLAMAEIIYQFPELSKEDSYVYTGLAVGLGYSRSLINSNVVLQGLCTVLPMVHLGYLLSLNNYALLFELGVESLSTKGSFENNVEQSTNLINGKFTIGIQF